MNTLTKYFPKHKNSILQDPYFWIIIFCIIIISFFYNSLHFSRIAIYENLPFSDPLVIWEYTHILTGSLFYIPLLFSILFYWWRGALITWLLSLAGVLPRLLFLYNNDIGHLIINLFYLSIPFLILAYISLEMRWRWKERQTSIEREKERQSYIAQIFKAQEDERKRIAHEIHDDPIQRLTGLAIHARLLTADHNLDNLPDIKKGIEFISDTIISVGQDLRRVTLNLRPAILDDMGLVPALRWLTNDFKEETGINSHIEVLGESNQLSTKYIVNIFRIVQEALNNVKKHSSATEVTVSIKFSDEIIKVVIQDNGKGFPLPVSSSDLTAKGKLGLVGMQQRSQLLNGNIDFLSEPGKGTTVTVIINPENNN